MSGISALNQGIKLSGANSVNFNRRFKKKHNKQINTPKHVQLELTRKTTKQVDSKGRLTKEIIEDKNGYKTINEYEYEPDGNLKSRTTTRFFARGNTVRDNFKYDENGNIVSRQTQFPAIQDVVTIDSSLLGKNVTFEYNGTYDENGMCNICKYKVIDEDGQEIRLPVGKYLSQAELIYLITHQADFKSAEEVENSVTSDMI